MALDLNERLISAEQRDYQAALRQSYARLRTSLAVLIGGGVGAVTLNNSSPFNSPFSAAGAGSNSLGRTTSAASSTLSSTNSAPSSRASSTLFSVISGTSGSSEA
jgi:hypothetical protein